MTTPILNTPPEILSEPELSKNALALLQKRYLRKDLDGNIIETPKELFWRVAYAVASAEKNYGASDDDIFNLAVDFYNMMASLEFLPNSPTLMNAGTELGQLSACFVLPIEDSIEGIFDAVKNAALIHKSGGGTGFSFSRLRPKDSRVGSTGGVASGPVSFLKIFNTATEQIKQGGCLVGDTFIATAEGPTKLRDLKEGQLVYSWDSEKGMVLRPCSNPWLTRKNVPTMRLTTEKGFSVVATPDHPFLLRSRRNRIKDQYRKLSELNTGTPLMPLTRYKKKHRGNLEWFISLQDGKDNRKPEHIWIAEEIGLPIKGMYIHHKDGNHLNNNVYNLESLTPSEHSTLHGREIFKSGTHPFLHLSSEKKSKSLRALQEYHANMDDDTRAQYIEKIKKGVEGGNQERIARGTHNFVNNPPLRNPEISLKAKRSRIARAIWRVMETSIPTREKWEELCCELPQQLRYKLSTIESLFPSFDDAVSFARSRNDRVYAIEDAGYNDVWNVEIEDTHNYVVCDEKMEHGLVVSNTRRGANMGILRIDHPDILDFIKAKEIDGELANFNLSVAITDKFMEALKNNKEYELINPQDGTVTARLYAKEVWDLLVDRAWLSGDPGVVFIDTINKNNPTPELGEIEATNPCGEQPLLPYEACNLGSINLSKFDLYGEEADWGKLRLAVKLAIHFLDNVIEVNHYPLPIIAENVKKTRKIGLGIMGFADTLYKAGIPYNSNKAVKEAKSIMYNISEAAWQESRELAKIRGGITVDSVIGNNYVRNTTVTTIAPTGSLSIIANCSSGIEPLFALSFTRNILDGEKFTETNQFLVERLQEYDLDTPKILSKIAENGTIQEIEDIPESLRKIFVTAMDIEPIWHLRMQAAFQEYTDNAVSKTINLPNSATREDIDYIYREAYRLGCKGTTVYRDGCKASQVLVTGERQKKMAGENNIQESRPAKQERPEIVYGFTQKIQTGLGMMYLTVNEIDGKPFEVFATIGKSGRSVTAKAEAIGRLISLALRSGIPVKDIVKQIRGLGGEHPAFRNKGLFLSIPDAIAWVLNQHYLDKAENKPDIDICENKCPECGDKLVFQEGCLLCPKCGYSKCG